MLSAATGLSFAATLAAATRSSSLPASKSTGCCAAPAPGAGAGAGAGAAACTGAGAAACTGAGAAACTAPCAGACCRDSSWHCFKTPTSFMTCSIVCCIAESGRTNVKRSGLPTAMILCSVCAYVRPLVLIPCMPMSSIPGTSPGVPFASPCCMLATVSGTTPWGNTRPRCPSLWYSTSKICSEALGSTTRVLVDAACAATVAASCASAAPARFGAGAWPYIVGAAMPPCGKPTIGACGACGARY